MNIQGLLHVSVLVADLERALEFYEGVLGLRASDERPELGFAGAWLDVGAQQIHLLALPNPDPVQGRPEHGGRDRHVALAVASLEPVRRALETAGVEFTLSRSGRRALFCRDPDGNALELVESAP
ncbi:MAG: VOC family protein [Pseudomonadota bacterium]|nr:MAG: VOC family protein [Pseudomonadota bacterium]